MDCQYFCSFCFQSAHWLMRNSFATRMQDSSNGKIFTRGEQGINLPLLSTHTHTHSVHFSLLYLYFIWFQMLLEIWTQVGLNRKKLHKIEKIKFELSMHTAMREQGFQILYSFFFLFFQKFFQIFSHFPIFFLFFYFSHFSQSFISHLWHFPHFKWSC